MSRSKIVSLILTCTMLCSLAACAQPPVSITEDGIVIYDTDVATDGYNYTVYASKELLTVMNILTTHMANSTKVAKGKYPATDELATVKADLDKVQEAIDTVNTLNPPNEYEDEREVMLTRLNNAKSTLEAYRDAVEDGVTDLADYADLMESDHISLTAAFNLISE